ncbi:ROK family protein [Accumulibacter sp.]|uniref:ROK family protein n=1 Tax=Accumulibacter sp. TaxID=2053492 RepID=UPI0025D96A43|nr:ROK family protein [Accumulibacter sp.]MCM8594687.1 ROK family protein [Accumulibacter sp.]MCM8625897.1 ROK family protein [Accumulibacter sp.]MDS4048833.1 ROK family protein [Accumulibacter sp.]
MRIGIDLGGTKIELIALDEAGGVRLRRRQATPRDDYRATLTAIAGMVLTAEAELGERGTVGIGIPGAESTIDSRIKNANSTWLIGEPLRADLEAHLQRELRVANDANCFALSEAIDGAGQGAEIVFGAILGTGVGGGIVVNRRALGGANRIAGEWGHNPLPLPDEETLPPEPCYCGRSGCVETWLSGPGLAADHRRHTGHDLCAEAIASRAAGGDDSCAASLGRYARRLAKALAEVVNILDPQVIVLGGGLSNIEHWYHAVPRLWGRHIFSDVVRTRLLRNVHGDSSGVRGAAWLWNDGREDPAPFIDPLRR